ncbi:MAG: radical SAM family heme chaperone HemW [Candidatus Marinimicrobia bacterium]|nr:radical SAM family heme chaperone HemW [Candidatus Neomarinimicrobiota bacterium]
MDILTKPLALYAHVPFCKAKCTYCDFYSIVGKEKEIPAYLRRMIQEIENAGSHWDLSAYHVDTIFFGGGTPNLLSPAQLDMLLFALLRLTANNSAVEIGMEVNPGEVTLEALQAYKSIGINRISIGMQSFQPELLKFMSRIHTVEQSLETYKMVRQVGFENVSADLIFAVPGQTLQLWESDLKRLIALDPEHISTYSLTVEEGTVLKRWVDDGHIHMLEDVLDTDMYSFGRDLLEAHGYKNYEISNFAKPGFQCRHNLNYWTGVEYLGFGPAAHSYFDGRRHWNVRDLEKYMNLVDISGEPQDGFEDIDQITTKNEMILTRLRLSEGLSLQEYFSAFGEDLLEEKQAQIKKWDHHLRIQDGHLMIARSAWSLIDEISSDLMDAMP